MKKNWFKNKFAFFMVLPALILVLIFMIYPLLDAFIMSFFNVKIMGEKVFIGISNYKKLLDHNEITLISLKNNIYFSLLTTLGTVVIGMILAILLDRKIHGWQTFRILYYLPVTLSSVVVSLLWLRIYSPNDGLLNTVLQYLGLGFLEKNWLGDPKIVIFSIILVSVWQYSGYTMIFFLAALQNIPDSLFEAARIDGINTWQEIFYISFPLIKPVIIIVIMLQLIFSFKVFDIVWVMSTGGPGYSSSVLGTYLYTEAFRKFELGYAQAIAVFMFVIIFSMSLIYLKLAGFREASHEY